MFSTCQVVCNELVSDEIGQRWGSEMKASESLEIYLWGEIFLPGVRRAAKMKNFVFVLFGACRSIPSTAARAGMRGGDSAALAICFHAAQLWRLSQCRQFLNH